MLALGHGGLISASAASTHWAIIEQCLSLQAAATMLGGAQRHAGTSLRALKDRSGLVLHPGTLSTSPSWNSLYKTALQGSSMKVMPHLPRRALPTPLCA